MNKEASQIVSKMHESVLHIVRVLYAKLRHAMGWNDMCEEHEQLESLQIAHKDTMDNLAVLKIKLQTMVSDQEDSVTT